jgi:general secretion pathway protein G
VKNLGNHLRRRYEKQLLMEKMMKMNRTGLRGFTLLELLIVMGLLAAIGGFLYANLAGQGDKGKASAAKVHMSTLGQALDLFKLEVGRYPNSAEGLNALMSAPGGVQGWNGPYLKDKGGVPKDPWNNDYRYTAPTSNGGYELLSLGADGREGGDGPAKDISSSN